MNRTGTYVAFDGLGQTDPSKSDFRYYSILQAWDANKSIDFKLTNSHEKTYAVRDTSSRATLYARIRERLSASKYNGLPSQHKNYLSYCELDETA